MMRVIVRSAAQGAGSKTIQGTDFNFSSSRVEDAASRQLLGDADSRFYTRSRQLGERAASFRDDTAKFPLHLQQHMSDADRRFFQANRAHVLGLVEFVAGVGQEHLLQGRIPVEGSNRLLGL